jgi:hypothetical protein
LFEDVLATGRALQDASQRAMTEGDAAGLREAVHERQRAVSALADVAVDALAPRGETARDAIERTITTVSVDGDAAVQVRASRLTDDLEPPDPFATLEPGSWTPAARTAPRRRTRETREPREPAKPKASTRTRPVESKPRTRSDADDRARRGEHAKEVHAAQRELETARREEEKARARAEQLAERARAAITESDAARRAVTEAIARTREAQRALAHLER